MKNKSGRRRDVQLNIRVTEAERKILDENCKKASEQLTEYILKRTLVDDKK